MNEAKDRLFAPDFTWGAATASYQIEGGCHADGRGLGNWDVFCRRPGAIWEGHTGFEACDHYGRLEEDLDLIAELGINAYRFGISWPRIIPEGVGKPNEAGLSFYERLVDGLLARNVTPYLTLFHWDTPQALEDRGGFRNPESPKWFSEMTELVARRLGDRVRHWFTLNEPHAPIDGGLREGRHAPGYTLPWSEVIPASHYMNLAHGLATQVLRAETKDSWIAMAPVLVAAIPASESPVDIEAARIWTFRMSGKTLRTTSWWMDPPFGKGYPDDGLQHFGQHLPAGFEKDLLTIAQPLDAVGFNLYDCPTVRADDDGEPVVIPQAPGNPRTAFNWPITPAGHYHGPKFAFERYRRPILITENGLSCRDYVHGDGTVPDDARIDFMKSHLGELSRAQKDGVPVLGYFHWSLLDNFEWNHGYRERFGLVHVDYQTFKRTKKESYHAYRDLIEKERGR